MTAKTIAAIALAAGTMLIAATADAGTSKNYRGKRYNDHSSSSKYDGYGHRYSLGHGHFAIEIWGYDSHRTCGYYKRKAHYTGASHWWKKYKRCIVRYH